MVRPKQNQAKVRKPKDIYAFIGRHNRRFAAAQLDSILFRLFSSKIFKSHGQVAIAKDPIDAQAFTTFARLSRSTERRRAPPGNSRLRLSGWDRRSESQPDMPAGAKLVQ